MAYRVEYGIFEPNYPQGKKGRGRVLILTAIIFVLFLSGVNRYWAEGAEVLNKLLSSRRFLETGRTLDALAEQVRNGVPLWDSLTAFCEEVVRKGMEYAA